MEQNDKNILCLGWQTTFSKGNHYGKNVYIEQQNVMIADSSDSPDGNGENPNVIPFENFC